MDKYFERYKSLAIQKGGKCISCIYQNNNTPLKWKCKRGHVWWMKPSYVRDGSWCKKCKKIEILNEMNEYAKSRGGKCLSRTFKSSKIKLTWKCAAGHTWESNSARYKKSWCPYCSKSVFFSESKCRFILEELTGHSFKTNRTVLGGLELDGYNADMKMAFEYHGKQHFEIIKYFHKDINLKKRQKRDLFKAEMCKSLHISLLTIPYWENSSDDNLVLFINKWLIKKRIKTLEWKEDYWTVFYKSLYDWSKKTSKSLVFQKFKN